MAAAVFCSLAVSGAVWAQAAADQVVVSGSISERVVLDAPYAITVIDAQALRAAGPQVNLSEAMARVPGLVVNNRNNYAQDLQISSRGFGARAGFGVRGLRLYSDGIPASMPDGQGQVAHFDLANAQRIEVLRGPFSVLYGNSSGGVISMFTAPVTAARSEGALDWGSFGFGQLRASLATPVGEGADLRVSGALMEYSGFRPQSEASRTLANVRLGWQDADDRVVVQFGVFDQPSQDPLGLSREQFDEGPYQTTPQALLYDTRKTAKQAQMGASWRHRFGDGALRESQVAAYLGKREVTQWLAIAPGTQGNPRHGGGVIDFDRGYEGVEAKLIWGWDGLEMFTGVAVERQTDDRQGYENFIGTPPNQQLGVTGRLRRNELNTATSTDAFVQAEWSMTPSFTASAGVRGGQVRMEAEDKYLSNGDDSGRRNFDYANPVLGLRWKAAQGLHLHASAALGFESPTLGELAYRPDGLGGFNTELKPQESQQIELGAKWRTPSFGIDAALFHIEVDDEIGVATNAGGRSSFQNVGRTRRQGAELSSSWQIAPAWRAQAALTWLDATYVDGFLACAGIPCLSPTVPVPAGNKVAGTQSGSAWAEVAWRDARFGEWGLEWRALARTAVNDTNSDFAAGYGITNLRWTKRYAVGAGTEMEFLFRIDNLADHRYAGSVIVNDANGRFFEPAAPRGFLLGVRVITGS